MAAVEPSRYITLNNGDHESILLKMLSQFRKDKTFCDLHVVIKDKEYNCHLIILAAYSQYFKDKVSGLEQSNGIYKLDITNLGCSQEVFDILLDFIYTGTVELPVELSERFLRESQVFKIESLRSALDNAFGPDTDIITFDNVVSLVLTCDEFDISSMKEHCIAFVCKNFMEIVLKKQFLEFTDSILKEIFSRDELLVDHEDDLIDAVLQWAHHLPSERCDKMLDIFKTLRWGRITFLNVNAKLLRDPLIRMNPRSLDFIAELSINLRCEGESSPSFNICDKPRLKTRTSKIVIVGGVVNGKKNSGVLTFDIEEKAWGTLPNLPKPLRDIGTVVIDNVLYVVGGRNKNGDILKSVISYDPVENIWVEKANMETPRFLHGLVAIGSKIFAIGGVTAIDQAKRNINTSSVECYDSVADSWHTLQQLPAQLNGVAACSSSGKVIHCFGGYDSNKKTLTDGINVYNVFTDSWIDDGVALSSSRHVSTAVCADDRIFVIGGYKSNTLSIVEEYLFSHRIFCNRKNMMSPTSWCSALSLGDKIYVLGSYNSKGERDIDSYDIRNDEWIKIDELKDDRYAYSAAILTFKK